LVALMSKNDLSEIDLRHGDRRIRLLRGQPIATMPMSATPMAQGLALPPTPLPPGPGEKPVAAEKTPEKKYLYIKSQLVGIFYAQENPEAPPFVTVGSRVTPETVVGIIMAMKLLNEVTANCSGVIAEILVENGEAVEFDHLLFKVDPSA